MPQASAEQREAFIFDGTIPKEPSLSFFEECLLTAFLELRTERPAAFEGQSAIPWGKIEEYRRAYGINNRMMFHEIIRQLDNHDRGVSNQKEKLTPDVMQRVKK